MLSWPLTFYYQNKLGFHLKDNTLLYYSLFIKFFEFCEYFSLKNFLTKLLADLLVLCYILPRSV